MLTLFYEKAYDFCRANPGFDGLAASLPDDGEPFLVHTGVSDQKPWPGVADVQRMTKSEWVRARLDAVARGAEEPALRRRGGDR
jgi:hypothetical protein